MTRGKQTVDIRAVNCSFLAAGGGARSFFGGKDNENKQFCQ